MRNNCSYQVETGDSWPKHYNAMLGLKQDMKAEKSAFE